ncbi:terminase small subunit [Ruminococcus sp. CAG:403]|nr:terminase small subunit [Ruminococcus sp. CAG:403]
MQRAYLERPQELVQAGLARLAFGSGADAVSLLLSGEERSPQQLRQMDLFNLSAVKRDKNGGVELHFFDRQRALERMYEYANSATGKEAAQNLLAALAGSGAQQDGDETESLLP